MGEGEFEPKEKYPDSWRLDHPDFGDVYKTTYAKGTIKEFEKVSDDPLKVKSMVKAEVEEKGTSDFIPLFFHPKKEYWDNEDEDVKATDFDKEKKYFKQAWMSFRAEDEVRVMLRDGKPYAVVGFDDGKPKIGEDIFKLEWELLEETVITDWHAEYPLPPPPAGLTDLLVRDVIPGAGSHFRYYQVSKRDAYGKLDEEKKGRDDLDLYLKKEIKPFNVSEAEWSETTDWYDSWAGQGGWEYHEATPPSFPPPDMEIPPPPPILAYTFNHTKTHTVSRKKARLYEWLIPIGPILYSLSILSLIEGGEMRSELWYVGYTNQDGIYENMMGYYSESRGDSTNAIYVTLKAGIYSEELLERLKGLGKNAKAAFDDGTNTSIDNPDMTLMDWKDGEDGEGLFQFVSPDEETKSLDVSTLKVFVRPHDDKEEGS